MLAFSFSGPGRAGRGLAAFFEGIDVMSATNQSSSELATMKRCAQPLWGGKSMLASPIVARLHNALVAALLLLMLSRVLWGGLSEPEFGVHLDPRGELQMRDMAAHQTFARAFWTRGAEYTVASHVRIASEWAGRPLAHALPFGYSPTMLWLLGPLVTLPSLGAFVVWSLLSGAAVWWMTRAARTPPIIGALVLLSPLGYACFLLGQTALLTAAGLLYLMWRYTLAEADRQTASRCLPWIDVLVLWALTAKPPLALTAGVALLAQRQWRTVGLALLLTVISTVALTPQLGWNWPSEYVHLLTHYDRETSDAVFTWSLRPDHMSNLRSLLWHTGWLGDHAACRLASVLWLGALGGLLIAAWKRRIPDVATWCLSVLAYLVFCTHVSCTEDLHLILIVAAAGAGAMGTDDWTLPATLIALCYTVTLLLPGNAVLSDAARSLTILAIKLILAGLIFAYVVRRSDVAPRVCQA